MDSKQLSQVRKLFEQVMNLTPSEAKAYLDEHCKDSEVQAEVDFLLSRYITQNQNSLNQSTTDDTVADTIFSSSSSSEDFFENLIGRRLNEIYLIEKKIGQGGMGAVFSGKNLLSNDEVAIKVLLPSFRKSFNDVKRFQREAKVGWSLSHPNIVKVFEFNQTSDDIFFMVMEFVKGQTLKSYIREFAPLPLNRCFEILKPLCYALDIAHRRNILHRDLKPANILLSQKNGNEVVKLADFGIAKLLAPDEQITVDASNLTSTGTVIGSLDYMSPEQLMSYNLSPSSDVYSLGVILYEMATGELPVQATDIRDLLKLKTTYNKLPPPSTEFSFVTKELDEVLKKALTPVAQQRYQKPTELLNALKKCLSPQ